MRLLYSKPELRDLTQGSRIAFVRQFRLMSQNEVSDRLGLTGECKRRSMTRYEKGDRNPKEKRAKEIANILNVSYNSIKNYDFNNPLDICYMLMWLEELIPKYKIDLSFVPKVMEPNSNLIKEFISEWETVKTKRLNKEISYEEYIEWKLNYEVTNY